MTTPLSEKNFPRGSEFYIYDNCEISFELMQSAGEEPATPFADKGTRVHAVLAEKKEPKELDDAEADLAAELSTQFKSQFNPWKGDAEITQNLIEERIWMRAGWRPMYSGQPDRVIVAGPRAFIPDFKTGWHPLDAITATNSQLRSYVPLVATEIEGIEEVTVSIIKPGKKSAPAVFGPEEIKGATAWALEVVSRVKAPGPKKPTKGPWCQYCSGKVLCPLWRDELAIMAQMDEAIGSLPDVQLRDLAPKLDIAGKVVEKLKARLYNRVQLAPGNFPDWRFEPGVVRRKIADPAKAYALLKEYVSAEEFVSTTSVAISELETIFRKARGLKTLEAAAEFNNLLASVIDKKPNKDSLVYDPQPAAITNDA
jgi:hypothetical protein